MKGMQDTGVMACAKHFPGHGDTDVDSHKDTPEITKSLSALENLEFYPFKKLLQKKCVLSIYDWLLTDIIFNAIVLKVRFYLLFVLLKGGNMAEKKAKKEINLSRKHFLPISERYYAFFSEMGISLEPMTRLELAT